MMQFFSIVAVNRQVCCISDVFMNFGNEYRATWHLLNLLSISNSQPPAPLLSSASSTVIRNLRQNGKVRNNSVDIDSLMLICCLSQFFPLHVKLCEREENPATPS